MKWNILWPAWDEKDDDEDEVWYNWGGCMLEFTQVEVAGGKQTKGFATREMQLWAGFEFLAI